MSIRWLPEGPPRSVQWPEDLPARTIRLDALAGPSETMQAAGFTNRGSLAYAMTHRDFPQPVKVLRGIRLWSLDDVQAWVATQDPPKRRAGGSS